MYVPKSDSSDLTVYIFCYIYLYINVNMILCKFLGVSDGILSYKYNWESCIDETVKYLGHAVGAMYVSHYFPKESQNQVDSFFILIYLRISYVIKYNILN